MGDGTKENPYTREDVLRLIEENGGTAEGLDLSAKEFEEDIDLHELNLEGIILKKATLKGAHFEKSRLWGAHLEGADLSFAHFEGASLQFTHLEGATLWYAEFSSDSRLEDIFWESYILEEEKKGYFGSAAITYRRLKMWHTNAAMHDIAANFYYREMEANRKDYQEALHQHLKVIIPRRKFWRFLFRTNVFGKWVRLWIYRLTCGYGEMWHRVIISAAVIVLGLAFIYFAIGTLTPNTLLDCLYYSAISFTALGYGSWVKEATGWVKGLGAFEAFVGVFMMALFLITFVRKMTR